MAVQTIQNINLGTSPNDGTGDPLRVGGEKTNQNFAYVDSLLDNRIQFLIIANIDWSQNINDEIRNYINANGVSIGKDQILFIRCLKFINTPNQIFITSESHFFVWTEGAGDFGTPVGNTIGQNSTYWFKLSVTAPSDITNQYNLGEIGTTPIEDAVNTSGPYDVSPGVTTNFITEQNGETIAYLYVGTVNGEIGIGANQTIADDYVNLNEQEPDPEDIGNIGLVSDISELESYTGDANTILVKDDLRGGIFNYVATGLTVDNGVVFNATGIGTGFWERQYNESNGVNATWWGAIPDGTTDLGVPTNAAIDFLGTGGGKVTIPAGDYLISNSIRIKSNITLDATTANLTLADNANQYMLRTGNDFQNELDVVSNIEITGGTWNGNYQNQTLNITDANSLDTDFYGWGIVVVNSENIKVHDLKIGSSLTWAISHMNCNNILFENIFIEQNAGQKNDDGVTGNSSNLRIDNVYGYTNDNLIAFHNEIISFGGHGIPTGGVYFPPRDIKNVTIKNITKYDSENIISGSAVINNAGTAGYSTKNVIIDGVKAKVFDRLINLGGYNIAATGVQTIRDNFLIQNVEVESIGNTFDSGTIQVASDVDNLTINNVFRKDIPGVIENKVNCVRLFGGATIKNLKINNVVHETRHEATTGRMATISVQDGFIENIQAENVSFVDTMNARICFFWGTESTSNKGTTRLQASNIYMPNNQAEMLRNFGLYTISANSISIDTDKEDLTPENGDLIKENGVLYSYNGTSWETVDNSFNDGKYLSLRSDGTALVDNTASDADLLYTSLTYLQSLDANIPISPSPIGGNMLTATANTPTANSGQLFMGTEPDRLHYRSADGTNGYSQWYHMASREHVAENYLPSTSPSAGLILHEQTISSTELTNSGTTPVDLLPVPSTGQIIVIEKVIGFMEAGTTPYDDDGLTIKYGNDVSIVTFSVPFNTGGNDAYEQQLPSFNLQPNQPIQVGFFVDPTQGDGILHLKIYYRIVEF